jgi:hypothetical protein
LPAQPADTGPKTGPALHPGERNWLGRLSLGATHLAASGESLAGSETTSIELNGVGAAADLGLEWQVAPALYVGGAMGISSVSSPNVRLGEVEAELEDAVLSSFRIGPSLTYYFGGDRGLYVHGTAGLATLKLKLGEGADAVETKSSLGPGLSAAIGYDFSIGDAASLGLSLRGQWASVSNDDQEAFTMLSPALLLTGTYGKVPR